MATHTRLFARGSPSEAGRVSEILRRESFGGFLLLFAAVVALIWANTGWSHAYTSLRDTAVGPAALHLHLTLGQWAGDGLLAIFFFIAGLELKREFVAGDLRDPRRAAIPVLAALGGVVTPALIYVLVNRGSPDERGWAVPTATDIAFALAVLAVVNTHLPSALRTFLLTLAVVDDMIAITIIAFFFTAGLDLLPLGLALLPLAGFALLVHRRVRSWYLLLPLALLTWALVHASGVHATVAGVLLAFTVPVRRRDGVQDKPGLAAHFEHRLRPLSAGLAVPIFAFFSAGVTVGGWSGLGAAVTNRVTIGVIVGLVVGKAIGIFGATYLIARFTRAELDENLAWSDVFGLAVLGGVGFTVSLLIGELAFGPGSVGDEYVKVGVLLGSLIAAILASIILRRRNRVYRQLVAQEELDPGGGAA